jgi:anti-sigma regulatory factor (Ser/Thr protein kinase)
VSVAVPAAAERFALELPPDPAYLATARLFASTVARQLEVDEERIEDLKLAVSEACTVGMTSGDSPLRLAATHQDGRLFFEVTVRGPEMDPLPDLGDDVGATLGTGLIEALFEGTEILPLPEGGRVIRFEVKVPSSGTPQGADPD